MCAEGSRPHEAIVPENALTRSEPFRSNRQKQESEGRGDLDEDKHPKHLREASCSLVARPLLNLSVGRDAHRFNRRLPGRDGMHAPRQAVVGDAARHNATAQIGPVGGLGL